MKKYIILLISVLVMLLGTVAYAENEASAPAPLTSDKFTLWIDVPPVKDKLVPSVLKAELHTTGCEPITSGAVNITKAGRVQINFSVPKYEIGRKFRIIVTDGAEEVYFYNNTISLWQGFTAETYAYADSNNKPVIHNGAHISIKPYSVPWNSAEKFVNSRKIKSKTDYLVWVSKKNFTVSVFLKRDYGWDCIRQIKCSIGAPNTPTVTGEFTYHQYQSRWQYDGYYVGPIMRFYRGYAIHSTLVNNDGTNRDARVGQMISHGCVRVLPKDIKWLTDYVPIGTKIYVTNE